IANPTTPAARHRASSLLLRMHDTNDQTPTGAKRTRAVWVQRPSPATVPRTAAFRQPSKRPPGALTTRIAAPKSAAGANTSARVASFHAGAEPAKAAAATPQAAGDAPHATPARPTANTAAAPITAVMSAAACAGDAAGIHCSARSESTYSGKPGGWATPPV